jgi:hypothetical protein
MQTASGTRGLLIAFIEYQPARRTGNGAGFYGFDEITAITNNAANYAG